MRGFVVVNHSFKLSRGFFQIAQPESKVSSLPDSRLTPLVWIWQAYLKSVFPKLKLIIGMHQCSITSGLVNGTVYSIVIYDKIFVPYHNVKFLISAS